MSTSPLRITSGEIPAGWPALVREIAQRDGQPVRAGADCTIEVKSLTDNQWRALNLPGGAKHFTTAAERDLIFSQIV